MTTWVNIGLVEKEEKVSKKTLYANKVKFTSCTGQKYKSGHLNKDTKMEKIVQSYIFRNSISIKSRDKCKYIGKNNILMIPKQMLLSN